MKLFRWAIALALLSVASLANATDIPITPTGPVWKFTAPGGPGALTWGIAGPGGFNNNFFFTPLSQSGSVCVYVKNNNTTTAHTFTASIVVTSDPTNTTPSDGTWQTAASSSGLTAAISPGLPAGIGVNVSGVSQVSINFSAASTQAGSPETASVTISQTNGNCFSGNQFIGSAPQTISSVTPMQAISEGLSQAYQMNELTSNPGISTLLLQANVNGGIRTAYFDHALVSSSIATTIVVAESTSLGTGCTLITPTNLKVNSSASSTSTGNFGCTGLPTFFLNSNQVYFVPANSQISIDLRGIIAPAGSITGVQIQNTTAVTGNVTATLFWYEK